MSSPDAPTEAPDQAADETEEAPAVDELRDGVVARLAELLGDGLVEHHVAAGQDMWIRVTSDAWAVTAETLRNVLGARYFCFLSAIDWKPSPFGRYLDAEVDTIVHGATAKEPEPQQTGVTGGEARFQVLARVANVRDHWGITIKADATPDDAPRVPTWTRVYAGADWHEREAWEMFGITFEGHPHLRHIYLPSEFEGYPLRKDFPLISRMVKPWPGIVDVEPMPTVDEPEGDTPPAAENAPDGGDPE
ncbi:MAG TPA: NADH-quinone oxidoreductase subunit C [Microthrixaceae bacterium]|nr:NADH-quinone oxidoreductase subunit C [Microthrixaceae bacterium]